MADIMVWLSGNSNVTGKHLWQGVAASWYLQTGAFRGSEMKERRCVIWQLMRLSQYS